MYRKRLQKASLSSKSGSMNGEDCTRQAIMSKNICEKTFFALEMYARVLIEKLDVTSYNRGFRTNNHFSATYEQVKKGLSYL